MTLIIETQSYHTHCTLQEQDIEDHLVSSLVSSYLLANFSNLYQVFSFISYALSLLV